MNGKWIGVAGLLVGVAMLGVGVYQMAGEWNRPSINWVRFDAAIPTSLTASADFDFPLSIRNENSHPITIYGEYTC
jgi:hypothetical protein